MANGDEFVKPFPEELLKELPDYLPVTEEQANLMLKNIRHFLAEGVPLIPPVVDNGDRSNDTQTNN